jgi:drug/metabolite transporter (DMT)-like permease
MTNEQALDAAAYRKNLMVGLGYLFVDMIASSAAQFLLKKGMNQAGDFQAASDLLGYLLDMINPWVVIGLLLYVSAQIIWILCLTKLDLSLAYPLASIQYIFVFLGAWIFFDEKVSWIRIVGLLLIMTGIIIKTTDKFRQR